jgi:hypothetical protein
MDEYAIIYRKKLVEAWENSLRWLIQHAEISFPPINVFQGHRIPYFSIDNARVIYTKKKF